MKNLLVILMIGLSSMLGFSQQIPVISMENDSLVLHYDNISKYFSARNIIQPLQTRSSFCCDFQCGNSSNYFYANGCVGFGSGSHHEIDTWWSQEGWTLDGELLPIGTYLTAVYDSFGVAKAGYGLSVIGTGIAAILPQVDNPGTTEKDGFVENESLNFWLILPNGCRVDSIDIIWRHTSPYNTNSILDDDGLWHSGGISVIDSLKAYRCGIATAPTCFDGIKNGTEEGIDCGGSCTPCPCVLATTDVIGNGNNGLMFDIEANLNVTIDSIAVPFIPNFTGNLYTYTKNGTYVGSHSDSSAWVLNSIVPVASSSLWDFTVVPINPISLNTGQVLGFYINTNNSNFGAIRFTNSAFTFEDATLKVSPGISMSFPFSNYFYSPRIFSGRIYYTSTACDTGATPVFRIFSTINSPWGEWSPTEYNHEFIFKDNSFFKNGDVVGTFYTRSRTVSGTNTYEDTVMNVPAFEDDATTTNIDGFLSNEKVLLQMYRDGTTFILNPTFDHSIIDGVVPDSNLFVRDGISVVDNVCAQQVRLMNVGWNYFSTYTYAGKNISEIFAPWASTIILVKNIDGKVWFPDFNLNDFNDSYDPSEGLLIKTYNGFSATLCGNLYPLDSSLILNDSRWYFVPTWSVDPVYSEDVFSGSENNIIIMKNIYGDSWIPSFGINTLGDMIPGEAYKLKTNGRVVGNYKASANKKHILTKNMNFFKPENYVPDNAIVIFPNGYIGEDDIIVYDQNNKMIGGAYSSVKPFYVTVWSNEGNSFSVLDTTFSYTKDGIYIMDDAKTYKAKEDKVIVYDIKGSIVLSNNENNIEHLKNVLEPGMYIINYIKTNKTDKIIIW